MYSGSRQARPFFKGPALHHFVEPVKRPSVFQAREAIRLLSAIPQPSIGPRKMGLLVTGLHLVCCWRYLAALVEGFESRGLHCLWEIWITTVVALVVGQVAKYFTPRKPAAEQDEELDLVLPDHGRLRPHTIKEGQELTVLLGSASAAAGAGGKGSELMQHAADDFEDDTATLKRRAQEEAAAKLAKYRAEVQQLLSSIHEQASSPCPTPVDAQLLFHLADQLFASSINVSEFVELGGVPVVVAAVRANTRSLAAAQRGQQQQEIEEEPAPQQQSLATAALPSMMQASWVLLQLSQGPPACKAALQEPQCSSALLAAAQAVSALPPAAARATEPVLRNIWWTLLAMCDRPVRGPHSSSSSSQQSSEVQPAQAQSVFRQQLLQQYQEFGAVRMLQQLVSLRHGLSAGWVAAAQLGLLMQLGHQQQQQQDQAHQQQQQQQEEQQEVVPVQPPQQEAGSAVLASLAAAAVQAVLQEETVTGLCYIMTQLLLEQPPTPQQQQQLSGRMRVLVEGMLHYMLTFHSPPLLQQLLELQLLGCFAAHTCPRLARLLVCQLLSSKGQEVLAAVEEGYEVDVPLGLAQIIPLKVHVRLAAPVQQPAAGEVQPVGGGGEQDAGEVQQPADDMYTDILACRLLLQHERLGELLSAFCEELQAPVDPQQQQRQQLAASDPVAAAAEAAAQECSVVSTGLALVQHLMSRDLQLQATAHVRGDCVSDTFSGSSSSSKSLDDALAMPDHSGTYSRVMAGMVPAERLPAAAATISSSAGSSGGSEDLTLPATEAPAGSSQTSPARSAGQVVFKFGDRQHALDAATFKRLRQCSKLVSSVLGRVRSQQQQQEPVTVLAIPQFTDEANCWVLQCLERWLSTKALDGFSVLQAAKLWVAADFLQVDELQVACEDVLAAAFKADAQTHMPVALELCARHLDSGGRLLRLMVQQLLELVSSACSGQASTEVQDVSQPQLQLLRQCLEQHTGLLLPVMHAELRDRLVTLCMLNAGQDAEDPADLVG